MTLIAALEGPEGMILAADSRGTVGDPRGLTAINDVQKKLFKLTEYCGITTSGAAELAARVIDQLKDQLKTVDPKNADAILDAAVQLLRKEYSAWFGSRPWVTQQPVIDQRPAIIFIIAGYRILDGQPAVSRIYLLASPMDFAPQLCTNGFMLAGIPQYAIYLMHRLYDSKMGLKSLKALAAYLITETASQDPKVGGPISMAQLTQKDGFQELNSGEVTAIVKANEKQSQRLKQFFFKGGGV